MRVNVLKRDRGESPIMRLRPVRDEVKVRRVVRYVLHNEAGHEYNRLYSVHGVNDHIVEPKILHLKASGWTEVWHHNFCHLFYHKSVPTIGGLSDVANLT